jgi:hypothetical protein
VEDLGHGDTAAHEFGARRLDVGHHEVQALDRSRRSAAQCLRHMRTAWDATFCPVLALYVSEEISPHFQPDGHSPSALQVMLQ